MASIGFSAGKYGAHAQVSADEARKMAVPGLLVGATLIFMATSGLLIYRKLTNDSQKQLKKEEHKHEIEKIKVKCEMEKDVYANKKLNDGLAAIILSELRNEQKKKGEEEKEQDHERIKPTIRQASDIPVVDGHYDDHQLVGKLLYREEICLCYGEEHVGKTSIILNWIIDIVLERKSRLMPNDKGLHPPYHCLWYNGEMNEPDFQNFFGNYDRTQLNGKIDIIEGFACMNLSEWLDDVRDHLRNCQTDTIVVLDNISCICNSTDMDVIKMRAIIDSIQNEMKKEYGIYVTFLLIGHVNKKNELAGTYKLEALFSARIRFSSYGGGHTKISIEKNRKYHDMVQKSFDLQWTISSEGYMSFVNEGEIIEESLPTSPSPPNSTTQNKIDRKIYPDEKILEFHNIYKEIGNKSEAERHTGVPRQVYDKRIAKILSNETPSTVEKNDAEDGD